MANASPTGIDIDLLGEDGVDGATGNDAIDNGAITTVTGNQVADATKLQQMVATGPINEPVVQVHTHPYEVLENLPLAKLLSIIALRHRKLGIAGTSAITNTEREATIAQHVLTQIFNIAQFSNAHPFLVGSQANLRFLGEEIREHDIDIQILTPGEDPSILRQKVTEYLETLTECTLVIREEDTQEHNRFARFYFDETLILPKNMEARFVRLVVVANFDKDTRELINLKIVPCTLAHGYRLLTNVLNTDPLIEIGFPQQRQVFPLDYDPGQEMILLIRRNSLIPIRRRTALSIDDVLTTAVNDNVLAIKMLLRGLQKREYTGYNLAEVAEKMPEFPFDGKPGTKRHYQHYVVDRLEKYLDSLEPAELAQVFFPNSPLNLLLSKVSPAFAACLVDLINDALPNGGQIVFEHGYKTIEKLKRTLSNLYLIRQSQTQKLQPSFTEVAKAVEASLSYKGNIQYIRDHQSKS